MIINKKYAQERKKRLYRSSHHGLYQRNMYAEATGALLKGTKFPFRTQYTERTGLALVPHANPVGFVDKEVLLKYNPENRTLTGRIQGKGTFDFGCGSFGQVRVSLPVRETLVLTDLLDPILLYNEVYYHRQLEEASQLLYKLLGRRTLEEACLFKIE